MKSMKRIVVALLGIMMLLSLAACGAEKTVTLRGDMSSQMGVPATDTWTLTAKGDTIQTMNEVVEIDLSSFDEETQNLMVTQLDSLILEPAKGIDGVTCSSRMNGGTYTVEMTIDCTGDAVKKAADAGLVTVDGNADKISLKQTQSSLTSQGFVVVE